MSKVFANELPHNKLLHTQNLWPAEEKKLDITLARRPGGTKAPRRNEPRPKRRKNADEVYSVPTHNPTDHFDVPPIETVGFTVTSAPTSYIPCPWTPMPVYGIPMPTLMFSVHLRYGSSFVDTENTHRLVKRNNAKNQHARALCRKPCSRNMVGRKNHNVYAHSDRNHRQRNN